MQYPPRTITLLKKYAHIIGGADEAGFIHPQDEKRQRSHLFVVKNRDVENASYAFMTGDTIEGKIIDGYYDISYIGLHKDYLPPDKAPITPEQKAVRKKVQKYWDRQEADIKQQNIARDAMQGIFHYDEDVPEVSELEETLA